MNKLLVPSLFLFSAAALAEQGGPVSPATSVEKQAAQETLTQAKKKNQKKPKSTKNTLKGDREAEGTKAANRFDEVPIMRSQYKVNGEALEVDPD